jgi:hypothetical protein
MVMGRRTSESQSDLFIRADKSYHANEMLTEIAEHTPYRPKPKSKDQKNGKWGNRTWTDKSGQQMRECYANRWRAANMVA